MVWSIDRTVAKSVGDTGQVVIIPCRELETGRRTKPFATALARGKAGLINTRRCEVGTLFRAEDGRGHKMYESTPAEQ